MELRSAHHVSSAFNQSTPFRVGDVVLIHDDKQPKHMWKMGRIDETFMGRDGKIRSDVLYDCRLDLCLGDLYNYSTRWKWMNID